jgi:hypothetical protein
LGFLATSDALKEVDEVPVPVEMVLGAKALAAVAKQTKTEAVLNFILV